MSTTTYSSSFATVDHVSLATIHGGQAPAPAPQPPPQRTPGDYSTNGNPVQQAGQMIDNAFGAFQGARKAGASWYESLGNSAIGLFNLDGGFGRDGKPR